MALEVEQVGDSTINLNVAAVAASLYSESGYDLFGNRRDEGHRWQEGFAELGLELAPRTFDDGGLYGQLSVMGTFTRGDGDAGGFATGGEEDVDIEDAYLGYRHDRVRLGNASWSLDASAGRQVITFGNGFLVASDGLSFGDTLGDDFDRGGAYYLAGREAFDKTASIKASNDTWTHQLAWIASDNAAQAETEFGALAVQRRHTGGLVELLYLRGLDVEERFATSTQLERDGMDTFSLRVEQSLGDALSLRGEYAHQDKTTQENAWYLEPSYAFKEVPWQPEVALRFTRFSEEWDPLFYGNTAGYGTWFQGEVAGSYAGPFNTNADVWHLALRAQPSEQLSLGALYFDFDSRDTTHRPDMGGRELNLYAEWMPTEWLYVSPLVGWYDPDRSAAEGGTQLGGDGTSLHAQFILGVFF
ncbi:hypothetical protein [Halomonas ramblicola]|uniref:hypothetical protein n=1 Tax=Halomonas ramblicola TaxID=747349 RepID=UPI0025B52922|nr:hypothetical protein [Halomonas ramblicola]MDN3522926.1 hypothetical protein [Halomonas ramblicola]